MCLFIGMFVTRGHVSCFCFAIDDVLATVTLLLLSLIAEQLLFVSNTFLTVLLEECVHSRFTLTTAAVCVCVLHRRSFRPRSCLVLCLRDQQR